MWWDRDRGDEQIEELVERRADGLVGRFRLDSVKLMQDGVLETFTGAMIDPYLDGRGADRRTAGSASSTRSACPAAVTRLDAAGFQPHFHAIGDRAVRECLDAVEAARRGQRPDRHAAAHRPHPGDPPDDIPRFAALDVVANAQPLLGVPRGPDGRPDDPVPRAGAGDVAVPVRVAAAGGRAPRDGLRLERVDRRTRCSRWRSRSPGVAPTTIARPAEPFLPEQRITLEEAIAAFTLGSAYVNHLDDETGSIEVGKLADLAVIDRDLFAPDAGPIGDARVLGTFVDGAAVFEDELPG